MKEKNLQKRKDRARIGKISGLIGILCNLILAGSKIAVGTLVGSMSITADGWNNLSDAASSIVTLTGFKLAEKPADREHPYGHARFEYLASLTVSVMILFIGFELAKSSLEKVWHPKAVEISLLSIGVLLVSMAGKLGMMIMNIKLGKMIDSTALLATAADSRNDVLTTGAVLLAALIEQRTGWRVDGIMGVFVAVFILFSGIGLAKETISPLLGEAVKADFRKELTQEILKVPMILGCHDLMVHDYGPGRRYASIHVEVDKEEDLMTCHEVIDQIERHCLERYDTNLVVHLDPVITDDKKINQTQKIVQHVLEEMEPRFALHDFRMYALDDKMKLVFDLIIPDAWLGKEEVIQKTLEKRLNEGQEQRYETDITFDPEPIE